MGIAFFLFGALFSCANDESDSVSLTEMDGSEVVLSLRLPGAKEVMTRLTSEEEDMMKEVDVLVFNHIDDEYLYTTSGYNVTESSITVRLLPTGEGQSVDLWVIANAHSVVNDNKIAMVGQLKEEIRLLLLAEESSHVTQMTGTATPIPMWGTKENVTVPKNGVIPNDNNPVNMIRMVAKINVQMSDELKNKNNFQLRSVHFFNRNTVGCIVPLKGNIDWTGSPFATAPSLPTEPVKATVAHSYDVSFPYTGIIDHIYAFETVAGQGYGGADNENGPCLIIGGKCIEEGEENPEWDVIPDTYYRIDFYIEGEAGAAGNYLALLRNHQYTVTLKSVRKPGFTNIEEALKNTIEYDEIDLEWTDDDLLDVVYNKTNYLAVSRSKIEIPDQRSIEVKTDCEGGWVISEKSDWLTIAPNAGGKNSKVSLTATALYKNETRQGYFDIVAGRLKKRIIVHQTQQDITFKEAIPANDQEIAHKGSAANISFEGTYDGLIHVLAYDEQATTIVCSAECNINTPANIKFDAPNKSFIRRPIKYMYTIAGVDSIVIDALTHYRQPSYFVDDRNVNLSIVGQGGRNTVPNIYPVQSGYSYLALDASLVSDFYAYALGGGTALSNTAIRTISFNSNAKTIYVSGYFCSGANTTVYCFYDGAPYPHVRYPRLIMCGRNGELVPSELQLCATGSNVGLTTITANINMLVEKI
jgi:hypothetical protein